MGGIPGAQLNAARARARTLGTKHALANELVIFHLRLSASLYFHEKWDLEVGFPYFLLPAFLLNSRDQIVQLKDDRVMLEAYC